MTLTQTEYDYRNRVRSEIALLSTSEILDQLSRERAYYEWLSQESGDGSGCCSFFDRSMIRRRMLCEEMHKREPYNRDYWWVERLPEEVVG